MQIAGFFTGRMDSDAEPAMSALKESMMLMHLVVNAVLLFQLLLFRCKTR